ncbi:hypothetical protein [Candidatus Parabeggiatoa sp. HSG14]|uniref:hypothetical protein n=1 Tax=Candidatus Parabeggiatoa sp. HSG14 TaxID=3055593 RepID=UPI0025A8F7E0|nr:hypothetical protein [Thiotrichales bacterium HSG14]
MIEKWSKKKINYTLFGLFLGEGSYDNGNITINHTDKQHFYVQWLKQLCIDWKLDYNIHYTNTTLKNSEIKIYVPSRRYFDNFGRVYNKSGKKVASKFVLNRITPLGILLWYLDSGHLHVSFKGTKVKRFAYLNTISFSYQENQRMQQMLYNRFGISCTIHKEDFNFKSLKKKVHYRLYFNATHFKIFYDLVREYLKILPKEFKYKFNMQYVPNMTNLSDEYTLNYNCD